MAQLIQLVLSNVPAVMFAASIIVALLLRNGRPLAARLLDWQLLLAAGVTGIWAGFFHMAFPQMAAQTIGWQVSPFQFEIGVADMAMGITAVVAFWRSLPFKAAVVLYIVLFNAGVAAGHIRQAVEAGNYAPNNFGLLLVLTIAEIIILPWLLWAAWKAETPAR